MAKSITKRSRIAEYATYFGIALWWLAGLTAWLEGHPVLAGLFAATGVTVILGAILIARPERRLRNAREE
jgi:hypothetical protein